LKSRAPRIHRAVNVGNRPYEQVRVFLLDRPEAGGAAHGGVTAINVPLAPSWPVAAFRRNFFVRQRGRAFRTRPTRRARSNTPHPKTEVAGRVALPCRKNFPKFCFRASNKTSAAAQGIDSPLSKKTFALTTIGVREHNFRRSVCRIVLHFLWLATAEHFPRIEPWRKFQIRRAL
jgi:hypothetical protein